MAEDEPSVIVNEDSTITFRYCGEAHSVQLLGDFLYADEDSTIYTDHSKSIQMRKGQDGCFHATTKPLYPDVYTYCFRVDGHRIPDPLNNDTSWQRLHKWNIIAVGGKPLADVYLQSEKEGELIRTKWYSSAEQLNRRVNIYLPAGYDTCAAPLDVLYLIHGINGYEGAWTERGRAIQILENLVAAGKSKPYILVMPDVNLGPHEDKPSFHTLWNSLVNYNRLRGNKEIVKSLYDLIQMVDTTYNVSDRFSIAGLSDGGRMAAEIAKAYPERVYAVGMFCPVVKKKQIPDPSIKAQFYLYVGVRDLFYGNGKKFHQRMEKAGIEHTYTEYGGRHVWITWRQCLVDFLEKIND